VKAENEQYLRLLERRLALLEGLTKALAESRADFVGLNLDEMHDRIGDQQRFCAQIQALDGDITRAQMRCAKWCSQRPRASEIWWPELDGADAVVGERIRAAMQRIAAAQAQLKRLNDAHQALLRRSRRTVGVLLNLFHSYAPTYAVQPAPPAGTLCEERA
jgi:hypothetical protein